MKMEYCPHRILQELILNLNFTKYELALFISSHSRRITAALEASPQEIHVFFRKEQIQKLIRMYKHIQAWEKPMTC